MNQFAVVIPYFGLFKPSIVLFLESCNRNPDIDWLVFTDCKVPDQVTLKSNVKWFICSLSDIKSLAERKLKNSISLERAYKLCDIKPMYGLIFEDYLDGYAFWGFGDTDVIYGDVSGYLARIQYNNYDKINWMGHLCFVRNNPDINTLAMSEVDKTISPIKVLHNLNNTGYDERDYNKKCLAKGLRIYNKQWAADIDIFYWRMRCADLKTFHYLLDTKEIEYAPKNYPKQLFALVRGRVYRIYIKRKIAYRDEFAYIHFRKEVPIQFTDINRDTFIISREGFIPAEEYDLVNSERVQDLINLYNNQENTIEEINTFISQYFRKVSGKRSW